MTGLERNKVKFWYALYLGMVDLTDADGNIVGNRLSYSNPVAAYGNISAAKGSSDREAFGVNLDYDKTINPLPLDFPATETSVLWVDTAPVISSDGSTETPYDYVISRVAKGLTHKAYAIKAARVS